MRILGLILFLATRWTTAMADASPNEVFDRVIANETLHCGYTLWPGYLEKDPNTKKLSGIMYDLVNKMGELLDLKIEWVEEINFGDIVEALRSKRMDAICGPVATTPLRAKFMDFSQPLLFDFVTAFVRDDDSRFDGNIEGINDQNITITVLEGEMAETIAASDFPKAKRIAMPKNTDPSQMLLNVAHKKADIVLTNPSLANQFLEKNPKSLRRIKSIRPLRVIATAISIRKGEEKLRSTLDLGVRDLLLSGFIQKLIVSSKKSFGFIHPPALPYEELRATN